SLRQNYGQDTASAHTVSDNLAWFTSGIGGERQRGRHCAVGQTGSALVGFAPFLHQFHPALPGVRGRVDYGGCNGLLFAVLFWFRRRGSRVWGASHLARRLML